MNTPNLTLSKSPYVKIVATMKTNYQIGYIVKHCPEPTTEQADSNEFDVIDWREEKTETPVFASLVKAMTFARKAAKTSLFGSVEIYEAELVNPYREDFPDAMVKRSALEWRKIDGGYQCEINR
jgi:hypothetical protein